MKLSVAIPCWSMNGAGVEMLNYNFNILSKQTLKDFEVVITDHSIDNSLEYLCKQWSKLLDIKYIKNLEFRGCPAHNTNLGLKNSQGDYIKLLCQDDYLLNEKSLELIYNNISKNDSSWMFSSYIHTNDRKNFYRYYVPHYNDDIKLVNTFGTPSALTIKNKDVLEFDNNLKFMYDCEFYHRMVLKYGQPLIFDEVTMVNYIHENQTTTSIVNNEIFQNEQEYIRRKFC